MLSGKNITKRTGVTSLLEDVTINIKPGTIVGITSLEHKETSNLLKILSGHDKIFEGNVWLDEIKLPLRNEGHHRFGISLTPGILRILPNLSILDNLILSLEVSGKGKVLSRISTRRSMALVRPLLDRFGFDESVYSMAGDLTLEDQSKLAIVKSLVENSDYILIQDVTANLSLETIRVFFDELRVKKNQGKGILFVPDNPNQIFELCDEVVVLRSGHSVFHRAVEDVDVEELYNILNNTEYTIHLAIENKFHQFRDNIQKPELLLERSLKMLGNFCSIFQCFAISQNSNSASIIHSKSSRRGIP